MTQTQNQTSSSSSSLIEVDLKDGKKILGSREIATFLNKDLAEAIVALLPAKIWVGFDSIEDAILSAGLQVKGISKEFMLSQLELVEKDVKEFWKSKKPDAAQELLEKSWKNRIKQVSSLWARNPLECEVSKGLEFVSILSMIDSPMKESLIDMITKQGEKALNKIKEQEIDPEELF